MLTPPLSRTREVIAVVFLCIAAMCWASNFVFAPLALAELPPITLGCLRWWLAFAVIAPFAAGDLRRDAALIGERLGPLFLLGAVGIGGFTCLSYLAFTTGDRVSPALYFAAAPLVALAIGMVLFGERPHLAQAVGVAVGILGVAIAATKGGGYMEGLFQIDSGDAFMMAATTCFAFYAAGQRWRESISPLSFITMICLFGAGALTPFMAIELAARGMPALSAQALGVLGVLTLFASLGGYLFFLAGARLVGGVAAAQCVHLVPVIALAVAIGWYGQPIEPWQIAAAALVAIGLALSSLGVAGKREAGTSAPASIPAATASRRP